MSATQSCIQCGRCCEKWGWDQKGCIEDILEWISLDRQDILRHVAVRLSDGSRRSGRGLSAGDLPDVKRIYFWIDEKGIPLRHCPFFSRTGDGKVYCQVHDVKPRVCRSFTPWNEGIRDYALNCPACRQSAP